ncbi:MAG: hypothetical protein KAI79_01215 [Bacteroidales bacterium]|nr:hypothetical protein [Bacteroidales bacterium]
MEYVVKNTVITGKECIGCERHDKDIMLTILPEYDDFVDIFLSKKQTKRLIVQLKEKLKYNKMRD